MSRFLLTTMPATGHVTPKLPIARELVTRGHDVHWYTGAAYRTAVEETGAVHHPIRSAEDFGGQTIDEAFPELRGLTGVRMVRRAFQRVFIDNAPGMFADCQALHAEHAFDAVLAEPLCLAARWLHEAPVSPGPRSARRCSRSTAGIRRQPALVSRPGADCPAPSATVC